MIPDPWWPVLVLAAICAVDAVMCLRPVRFIAECFEAVRFPRRWWWVMPPIKAAAAAGLVAGVWLPWLGLLTTCCLVLYFVLAIGAHLRARAHGPTLYVNATGMLLLSVAVLVWCFLW